MSHICSPSVRRHLQLCSARPRSAAPVSPSGLEPSASAARCVLLRSIEPRCAIAMLFSWLCCRLSRSHNQSRSRTSSPVGCVATDRTYRLPSRTAYCCFVSASPRCDRGVNRYEAGTSGLW
eukprot:4447264-Prymnesium_polylepis.1